MLFRSVKGHPTAIAGRAAVVRTREALDRRLLELREHGNIVEAALAEAVYETVTGNPFGAAGLMLATLEREGRACDFPIDLRRPDGTTLRVVASIVPTTFGGEPKALLSLLYLRSSNPGAANCCVVTRPIVLRTPVGLVKNETPASVSALRLTSAKRTLNSTWLVGGGAAIIPSTKKVAAAGATLTMPVTNKDDIWSFDEMDAAELAISDAPRPDEVVVLLVLAEGGRPHARTRKPS
mgnify:CR=1 FL=1